MWGSGSHFKNFTRMVITQFEEILALVIYFNNNYYLITLFFMYNFRWNQKLRMRDDFN